MRPINVVVVDFPFVPVIAITRPRRHRDASSGSRESQGDRSPYPSASSGDQYTQLAHR